MKIRNGFVSNSSTSSFICRKYSLEQGKEKLEKTINCYNEVFEKDLKFDNVVKIYLASRKDVCELIEGDEFCYIDNEEELQKSVNLITETIPTQPDGRYLVIETEENSLSDELLFWIENLFSAYRIKV